MKTKLLFEEPPILLGETSVGSTVEPFYLPLLTTTGHTLLISRSGGGKSHTLATLAFGMAKAAAIRRLNLLVAELQGQRISSPAQKVSIPPNNLLDPSHNLLGIVPGYPSLSLCVFDPHRDLAKRLREDLTRQIAWVRVHRRLGQKAVVNKGNLSVQPSEVAIPNWEEVLEEMITYLDLGDRENVFGLNLLDTVMWESKENCASTLIEIFKRIYPDAWGSRMEDVFRHSIFALYLLNTQRRREEQFTLLDIVPFITIDLWRETLLTHPIIAQYNVTIAAWWRIQFAEKMSEHFRNEVIKPVLNKLNPFVGSDILSSIFGQSVTTLDFEPLIAGGNIILIDLAASEIETENCALAGAILIGFLLKKARHLADGIEQEVDRPLVQLMVDEFNVILAAPYADIMGQYRKWGVRATLATQSLTLLDKLDPTLRPLVMANAANLLVLQVNAEDAEYLRRELVADGTATARATGIAGFSGSLISPSAGGGGIGPDLYDLVNAERGMCYFKGTFNNVRQAVFTVRIAPRPFGKIWQARPYLSQLKSNQYQIEKEIELERRAGEARLLERCRQQYTLKAGEVSASFNRKQQDYLNLYTLNSPDFAESTLLSGFTSWQLELSAMLERRLKQERRKQENQRTANAKTSKFAKNKALSEDENTSEEESPQAKVSSKDKEGYDGDSSSSEFSGTPPGASLGEKDNGNKDTTQPAVSGKVIQLRNDLPAYAPGHNIKPPVRKSVSPEQVHQESRQLPDGTDYSAQAQIRKERAKQKAQKKRRWQNEVEAQTARQQGFEYARHSYEGQNVPDSLHLNYKEENTS